MINNSNLEEDIGKIVGVLEIIFRHIEGPAHVTRDIIFIDTMAVAEKYRGLGIGHKMFEFLKIMKIEKTWMELNYKLMLEIEMRMRCIKSMVLQKNQ